MRSRQVRDEINPYALGMTPMGFPVCSAMMGDSSSVTAAGWLAIKKRGGGNRDGCSRTNLEAMTATFREGQRTV